MNILKYLFQFLSIFSLFFLFKLIGLKIASILSGYLFLFLVPLFRSKKIINNNLLKAFPNSTLNQRKKILKKMWFNYGRIFAEYMFIKDFRNDSKKSNNIIIENPGILEEIKKNSQPVIFISGHFNNFELMAMQIEKSGIDLAAVYRPLNNKFINPIMENIRRKYICKKQIKKGLSGTKELLLNFKNGTSIALMIDQRVSQGIQCNLFGQKALTTTIPAQFVKKFNAKIVPVYIERKNNKSFKINFQNQLEFTKDSSIETITTKLNKLMESMIVKNPDQWIWSHNRWK